MAAKGELRLYMEAHPLATIEHLTRMFKCSKQSIWNIRTALRKTTLSNGEVITKEEEAEILDNKVVSLGINLPEHGLILKMTQGKKVVGTLHVTATGAKFFKSNQKKAPAKWFPLEKMEEITNLLVQ
jgi:hypothetical protein